MRKVEAVRLPLNEIGTFDHPKEFELKIHNDSHCTVVGLDRDELLNLTEQIIQILAEELKNG
jgi:hypothetical protein